MLFSFRSLSRYLLTLHFPRSIQIYLTGLVNKYVDLIQNYFFINASIRRVEENILTDILTGFS